MRKYNENPKKFSGTFPQTPPGLCPGPAGGFTAPPKPPADYSDCCVIVFLK